MGLKLLPGLGDDSEGEFGGHTESHRGNVPGEAGGDVPARGSCCGDKAKGAHEHPSPTQAVINDTELSEQDKMMIFGVFIGKEIFEGAPSIWVMVTGKRYLFRCVM